MPKILVIDDDVDLVLATRVVLEREGHKVIIASNGKDGLSLARSEKPDLILLDIVMPVLDGYSFADEFNSDVSLAKIPLIALTSYDESPLSQPVPLNVTEYVNKAKTSRAKDLISLVNKYLKK
jgi:CheY-like chemotaxis protein